jgi:thioredoxin 1
VGLNTPETKICLGSGRLSSTASNFNQEEIVMSYVLESDDNRFDYDVLNKDLVLVDFHATWCQPCKQMAPILEELARKVYGEVGIVKIDVDENKYLSERYDIRSIPTMVLFKKGMEIARRTGVQGKGFLAEWLKEEGL